MDHLTDIWALIDLNRYQEAKALVQVAILEEPGDAELFFAAAFIENELNQTDKAYELVLEGLSKEPLHKGLRYLQFVLLKGERKFVDAEEVIISLLKEYPAEPDFLCGYARLMMATFHLEKARALCNEALRISPEHQQANNVSFLLNICEGNTEVSNEELKQIVLQEPESEQTLSLIAVHLLEKKQYRQAESIMQELVRIDPNDQDYIDTVIEIKTVTHWSSLPNWPLNRFGWPASIFIWFVALVLIRVVGNSPDATWVTPFAFGYLGWVVYTWVQPFILKAILKR